MVRFEFSETEDPEQDLGHIGISAAEIIDLASCRRAVGYWRSDLATGHVFWSRAIFDIYGMSYTQGPVNLTEAYSKVHRDDLKFMLELIERAASQKIGFHYVLRLKNGGDGFKFIRSVGLYRINADGREELYGNVEQILEHVRLIGVLDHPTATA